MIIYKFSVFKHDWVGVCIDTLTQQTSVFINNHTQLLDYYQQHHKTIWIGYNSNTYDKYILQTILAGYDPYDMTDHIINKDKQGWEYSESLDDYPVYNYDTKINQQSLKAIIGNMGHDITIPSVPFNSKHLSNDELLIVAKHLIYDTEQILEIFVQTIDRFNAHLTLINQFGLHIKHISKSLSRLGAEILRARKANKNDEYDVWTPEEVDFGKYIEVETWLNRKRIFDEDLILDIAGVENKLGKGGIHGARLNYHTQANSDEYIILLDVTQLYPTLLVKYDLLSRGAKFKSKYLWSYDESLRLKELGEHDKRLPYKEFCNVIYGASGSPFNPLYDPRNRLLTCVYGQSFIVDLIDKLEPYIELIQSNTDGILVKIKKSNFGILDDIVYQWEERTGLCMDFEYYDRVYQKDVNNYILVGDRVTAVGQYTKDLSVLDNDLPIVNKAVRDYFIYGTPVEETINQAKQLIDFQRVINISSKFDGAKYGREIRKEKAFRVFADVNGQNLSYIKNDKLSKIPHTPDTVRVVNEDIIKEPIPSWLNKTFYIDLAQKRVDDFIGKEKVKEMKVTQLGFWG